jgi:hypothetical protein
MQSWPAAAIREARIEMVMVDLPEEERARIRDAQRRQYPDRRQKLWAMSFRLSFHQALLGATGAQPLDDTPDLSCHDGTCDHGVDGG